MSLLKDSKKQAYRQAKKITRVHATTYFYAIALLPPPMRHAIYPLYAFARIADDICDQPGIVADKLAQLSQLEDSLLSTSELSASDQPGVAGHPYSHLVNLTRQVITDYGINPAYFRAFFRSMRMDIPLSPSYTCSYNTFSGLSDYTYGSAGVIGLQLLPILEPQRYQEEKLIRGAQLLGEAFQLTNFLRDIGEDLQRDRIYLPLEIWASYGVTPEDLYHQLETRTANPAISQAIDFFINHTTSIYQQAAPAIAALDPQVQPAIAAATRLYSQILDRIASNKNNFFNHRVHLPTWYKIASASAAAPKVITARIRAHQ